VHLQVAHDDAVRGAVDDDVKERVEEGVAARGDLGAACEARAAYYAASGTAAWLRPPAAPAPSGRLAGGAVDAMVFHDVFTLSGVDTTAKVPRNADGGLDWLDRGPRFDYEFLNCLNHQHFVHFYFLEI
jgi:hypothetical protein